MTRGAEKRADGGTPLACFPNYCFSSRTGGCYCGTQGFPFTPSGLRRQGLLSRVKMAIMPDVCTASSHSNLIFGMQMGATQHHQTAMRRSRRALPHH